tara:strand:- start:642 stop:1397 length:756 start_codon:yes stop_codon:yes gene_type:complete
MKLKKITDGITFGTNILDIEVPEHLKVKFASGITFFDEAMGGQGFTPSAVTLFTGAPGAGKTTLMLTLADAMTKKGATVLFNTAEESLFQTAMTAKRLKLKNGFRAGNSASVTEILENAEKMQKEAKKAGNIFVLIVDSLQCLDDDKYSSGKITSGTAIRCLQQITDFCKDTGSIGIIINQVNKSGKMAGSNKLKHMVDSHVHLGIEEKDEDFKGCRILETQKNRFGGCGHMFYLSLRGSGFRQVAKIENF